MLTDPESQTFVITTHTAAIPREGRWWDEMSTPASRNS
jgi:hypothetical protein